jgi:cell division septation protein DedD
MSAFDSDISVEEQKGGFDLGAPDDETFKLEKLDEYPGVMPDFDYEVEPIIPTVDEDELAQDDDDEGLEEFSEEFDELDEIPDIADELGDFLGEEVSMDDDEAGVSEELAEDEITEEIQDDSNDELGVFASDVPASEEIEEEEEDPSDVIPENETEEEKALRELLGSEKKRSDEIKADKKAKEPDSKFGFGDDDIEPVQDEFIPVEEQHGDAELIDLSEISADKPSTFGLETVTVREVDDGIEKPEDEDSEEGDDENDKKKKDKKDGKKKKPLSKRRFIFFVSSAAVILLSVIGFAGYQMIYNTDDLIIPGDTLAMEYEKGSEGELAKNAGLKSQKRLKKKVKTSNNNPEEDGHYKEFEDDLDKKMKIETEQEDGIDEIINKKIKSKEESGNSDKKSKSEELKATEDIENTKENKRELNSEKVNLSAENKKRLIAQSSSSSEEEDKKIKKTRQTKDIAKRSTVSNKERTRKKLKYPNTKRKSQSDEGLFAVQIYSSLSEDDARDWLAKLNDKNIKNGFITTQLMRDKIWYRVRFGEFESRQKAQAAAMQYGFAQSWVDRIK